MINLEHGRCGNKSAQGNALGLLGVLGLVALKGHDKCRQLPLLRPYRAIFVVDPISQGVALG
jgi:hypothetical protein